MELIAGVILISGLIWWAVKNKNVAKAKDFQEGMKILETNIEKRQKEAAKSRTSKPS